MMLKRIYFIESFLYVVGVILIICIWMDKNMIKVEWDLMFILK